MMCVEQAHESSLSQQKGVLKCTVQMKVHPEETCEALHEIFRTEAYISPQETGGGGFV
jgi:hypothetical protein